MTRRIVTGLSGVMLCMAVFAVPVAAHGFHAWLFNMQTRADGTVFGTITNHTYQRRLDVTVTGGWSAGGRFSVDRS